MIYTGTYIIYVHVIITSFIKGMLFTASYVIKVTSLKSLGWNQKEVCHKGYFIKKSGVESEEG
jgi:5-bromo-4-chloroindolyl phosphate hydrolysis protein